MFTSVILKAQNPTYELYIENETLFNPNVYQFDLFILRTGTVPLNLRTVQIGLGIDVNAINGGTLSVSIVNGSSELNPVQIPNTNLIVFTSNPITTNSNSGVPISRIFMMQPANTGSSLSTSTIISDQILCGHPGTRIATYQIANTVQFAQNSQMNLVFNSVSQISPTLLRTAISAWVGNLAVDITNAANNFGFQDDKTLVRNIVLNQTPQWHQRRNIYSFDCSQRQTLALLIMQYLNNSSIIEDHCATMSMMTLGGGIHSDFSFLPFHRKYIEGLEDYLYLQGHPEFVPLPYWDPATSTPIEFRIINLSACGSAQCDPTDPPTVCTGITNWFPERLLPNYLNTIIGSSTLDDICDFNMDPTSPTAPGLPNCCDNGLSRVIEGQGPNLANSDYHNSVHGRMGYDFSGQGQQNGVMFNFRSPSAPIFWLWHAMVDDIWKSWECNCSQSTTKMHDLYMADTPKRVESERDEGEEPNIDMSPMWETEDIWCRNAQNGLSYDIHQNPIATNSNKPWVYVRIRNRGCSASLGNEILYLYWAKAATDLSWPSYWNTSVHCNANGTGPIIGDLISVATLPVIQPGGEWIQEFHWLNVPNPSDYNGCSMQWNNEPLHYCLLARMESTDDPMTIPETMNLGDNVRNNNNIIWKNVTVIDNMTPFNTTDDDCNKDVLGGSVLGVGNPFTNGAGNFDLRFKSYTHKGSPEKITNDAEVKVRLDDQLWAKWRDGGFQSENIEINNEACNEIKITGEPARIMNLTFNEMERNYMFIRFNYLMDHGSMNTAYDFRVIESKTNEPDVIIGGETYHIIKSARPRFYVNAGPDKSIMRSEDVELFAADINEPAVYNWYDGNDKFISSGKSLTISPDQTTQYKLEVIAKSDGYKSYDFVTVNVKQNAITSLNPNPAVSELNVGYYLQTPAPAFATLMISKPYGNSTTYDVDVNSSTLHIDLSSYITGLYDVILFSNGQIADSKTLSIIR